MRNYGTHVELSALKWCAFFKKLSDLTLKKASYQKKDVPFS